MLDAPRLIPTTRPDGALVLECPCGYRAFTDSHGKAVCPKCGRAEVVEAPPGPQVATKEQPTRRGRK